MIRSIGNTPMVQNSNPYQNGNQQSFKAIVVKDFPKGKLSFNKFLKTSEHVKELKGGNIRSRLETPDVFTYLPDGKDSIYVYGKTKEAEMALYEDLSKRQVQMPEMRLIFTDDWVK